MKTINDSSPVAVVTGASRGTGKGIAVALGARGATVYVTGRSRRGQHAEYPGSIEETADCVTAAGGNGIAVPCDHADDREVERLFTLVGETEGHLDILVNNAAHVDEGILAPGGFWEKPVAVAKILDVGLRSSYVSSYYAAPLMVAQKSGLIVNTSFYGGVCYFHGPAYGAQKAGLDKLAADMAVDLRPHNVCAVSLWMGFVTTERTLAAIGADPDRYGTMLDQFESPEFSGHVIASMYHDPELMRMSGNTVIGAELAVTYGIKDTDGRQPPSYRETMGAPREPQAAVFG
ncbi:SDR family NAD(P)-dependent oxidoreductase [Jatrophihabitans sp. DSM 45814]